MALLSLLLLTGLAAPVEAHRRAVFPAESLGASGINVTALQHLLRERGWSLSIDGIFGSGTQAAVAAFQRAAGLDPDGVVDAATWTALLPPLGSRARGEAVTALQHLLNGKRRVGLSLNATYDGATLSAVIAFQKHMGLRASGEMDLASWRNLLWHYVFPDFADSPLCDYHSGSGRAAHWGTSATVAHLEAAAALFRERSGLRISVGELSFQHGGPIPNHSTHEVGLDVDLGLIRRDGRHCHRLGLDYRDAQYDRQRTRELIQAIYETAPGRVKLIYFNDPVLVREGLVVRYPNHGHHLHVRYCEVGHAQRPYRCAVPALSAASEAALVTGGSRADVVAQRMSLRVRLALHRF